MTVGVKLSSNYVTIDNGGKYGKDKYTSIFKFLNNIKFRRLFKFNPSRDLSGTKPSYLKKFTMDILNNKELRNCVVDIINGNSQNCSLVNKSDNEFYKTLDIGLMMFRYKFMMAIIYGVEKGKLPEDLYITNDKVDIFIPVINGFIYRFFSNVKQQPESSYSYVDKNKDEDSFNTTKWSWDHRIMHSRYRNLIPYSTSSSGEICFYFDHNNGVNNYFTDQIYNVVFRDVPIDYVNRDGAIKLIKLKGNPVSILANVKLFAEGDNVDVQSVPMKMVNDYLKQDIDEIKDLLVRPEYTSKWTIVDGYSVQDYKLHNNGLSPEMLREYRSPPVIELVSE